jgi:hypothetical protein
MASAMIAALRDIFGLGMGTPNELLLREDRTNELTPAYPAIRPRTRAFPHRRDLPRG